LRRWARAKAGDGQVVLISGEPGLGKSRLPQRELDEAKRVVSAAVAKMLVDYAGALSLDDIESVAFRLCEHGRDQGAAGDVVRKALKAYIRDIDSTLSEISSLEELEEFEHELKRVMREFDLYGSRADRDIQYRREHLIEGEEHGDEDGHGRSTSLSQAEFSDDQIKSMFQGLLGR
jgi:predicted ATPase